MNASKWLFLGARATRPRCEGPVNVGFTLLEVVLATALTAMLATAGWTWARGVVRAGDALQHRLAELDEAAAVARIMADDCRGAAPRGGMALRDEGLCIRTLAEIPGQSAAGWREIVWQWSPTVGLMRRDKDSVRIVSRGLRCVWRTDDLAPPHWWVEILPQAVSDRPLAETPSPSPSPSPVLMPWRFCLGTP